MLAEAMVDNAVLIGPLEKCAASRSIFGQKSKRFKKPKVTPNALSYKLVQIIGCIQSTISFYVFDIMA